MKLLNETTALEEIRSIIGAAQHVKIGVAFWGKGATQRLGLGRDGLTAEIICNLDSGACNPVEIERLMALPGVKLRAHASLHAKVYWSKESVVLGSSNASTNGLAITGDAAGAWSEANVRLDAPSFLTEVESWFDGEFEKGYEIGEEDLERARLLWKRRAAIAPPGKRLNGSVLELFAKAPDHPSWDAVKVAYSLDSLDKSQEKRLQAAVKAGNLRDDLTAYGDWNEYILPSDWIIDFDRETEKKTVYTGIYRALPIEIGHDDLRAAYEVKYIDLPGFGRITVSAGDKAALRAIAPEILRRHSEDEGRNAVVELATAATMIAKEPVKLGALHLKKFDAAMEQVYDDAASFKYYPKAFLKLLKQKGGLATAQQLLRSDAMRGLTTLWEHSRLDVSVEALVLKSEWSGLFTDEERAIARKRLKDLGYTPAD